MASTASGGAGLAGDALATTCARCGARGRTICAVVPDEQLSRLASAATQLEIPKGRVFIEEGDPAPHVFNITAGTAKLFKVLPDGRQQITGFAGVGDFVGLAASDRYGFSAEAIAPLQLCRFTRPALRRLFDEFPAMEARLLEVACSELVSAQERILLLGRKTAGERVASFLVERSRRSLPCGDARIERLHLPMKRADIADYLGLTIETVSRTMSRLRGEKLIAVPNGSDVVILNQPALESLAEGMS